MKLFTKIFLSFFFVIFLTFSIFFTVMVEAEKSDLEKDFYAKIEFDKVLYSYSISMPLYEYNNALLKRMLEAIYKDKVISKIELIDQSNLINIFMEKEDYNKEKSFESEILLVYNEIHLGKLLISYSRNYVDDHLAHFKRNILIFTIILFVVALFIIYLTTKKLTKSLINLTDSTTQISKGDLSKEIDIKSNDEIGVLADKFEKMRKNLKERIETIDHQNIEIKGFNETLKKRVKERTVALLEEKNRFETLVNSIPDLVWMKDPNGVFVYCNTRVTKLIGLSSEEILGKTDYDLFDEELAKSFLESDKKALHSDTPQLKYETVTFAFDGHKEKLQTIKTAVKDNDGNILGTLGIGRDITELQKNRKELEKINNELMSTVDTLKNTQKQLVEAEKLSSLGVLVAGIAHEINTPVGIGLTGVTHFIEITNSIKDQYKNESMTKDDFERYLSDVDEISKLIESNLHRTANLVKNFKQISFDQTSEESREIDLRKYIDEIIFSMKNVIKKSSIIVKNDCDEDIKILTYPGAISQIITNLIFNSILHGFSDYEVNGEIHIKAKKDEKIINLKYIDNGRGIKEEHLSKIFDPFFTTNRQKGGTGLGLNIIYNIVTTTLNGLIKCNSKVNNGVEFDILFQENITDNN